MWQAGGDGQLGTGTVLSSRDLSPGRHVITLAATDSEGSSAKSTIAIAIDGERSVDIPSDADLEQLEAFLSGDVPESSVDREPQSQPAEEPEVLETSTPPYVFAAVAAALLIGLALVVLVLRRAIAR